MNNNWALMRAIRGPILLIALGILFVLDHMDILPIGRAWPILIIVIGVLKLIERATAPRTAYSPYGPYPQQQPPPPPEGGTQI